MTLVNNSARMNECYIQKHEVMLPVTDDSLEHANLFYRYCLYWAETSQRINFNPDFFYEIFHLFLRCESLEFILTGAVADYDFFDRIYPINPYSCAKKNKKITTFPY